MVHPRRRGMPCLLSVLVGSLLLGRLSAQEGPKPEELAKMAAAMPAKATVAPKAARRILVINTCHGFKHSAIPYGAAALEMMGRQTGAFETVVTDDLRSLDPANLAGFDAIVINNATLRLPLVARDLDTRPEAERAALEAEELRLRQALLDFVRQGKGIVGVHAATDALYDWPEYGEMMGGYFWGHPWNEEVAVKVDDPAHPLMRAFRGTGFTVADEIYQFRDPYSREQLRVLLSLDVDKTNMNKGEAIKRTDGDFAVAWIREFGQGRVFYFSLGHRHEIFWNRPILQCYLDGIQYALGDLPADATPSAQLGQAYLEESRREGLRLGLAETFTSLAGYQTGVDDSDAKRIEALVTLAQRPGQEDLRRVIEAGLAALVARPEATLDCRRFACRELSLIGTAEAVPPLAGLLADAGLAEVAIFALERIPDERAAQAMTAALTTAPDPVRAALALALGRRRHAGAVPGLAALLRHPDNVVASAAAAALGQIGVPAAVEALLAMPAAGAVLPALVDAGAALAGSADPAAPAAASAALTRVLDSHGEAQVRGAAFKILAGLRGEAAVPDVLAALRQEPSAFTYAAVDLVASLPGTGTALAFAAALDTLPALVQPMVLDRLAMRGDRSVRDVVLAAAAAAGDEAVRLAALAALEQLGDANCAILLATTAAEAQPGSPLRDVSRRSLERLQADGADAAMLQHLDGGSPAVQGELVRALGLRQARLAVPKLLALARSEDRDLSRASLDALDQLAGEADLPALVALLGEAGPSVARSRLETSVVAVARRAADAPGAVGTVLAGLRDAPGPEVRSSLFSVLGRIAHAEALPTLTAGLGDPDDGVRRAAIRALADWPDASPMEDLQRVSISADNEAHRVLALRGYARQLAMPSPRPVRETLQRYRDALAAAQGESEKRSLITGLGDVVHPDALTLAREHIADPALQAEALVSAIKIMRALDGAAMKLSASRSGGKDTPEKAIDGKRQTRWTSGRPQAGDEWFEIDLGYECSIGTIALDAGEVGSDWPRAYTIRIASREGEWGEPVLTGSGNAKVMTLTLPEGTYGRFIRIEQTGTSAGNFWSIAELKVDGRPETLDEAALTLDRSGWVVTASEKNADAPNAIDGDRDKRWGTGRGQRPGDWFQIDLGTPRTLRRIILDAAKSGNDYPRGYRVMVSDDGETWYGPIGVGEPENKAKTLITVLPTKGRFVRIVQTGNGEHWWWSIYDLQILAD